MLDPKLAPWAICLAAGLAVAAMYFGAQPHRGNSRKPPMTVIKVILVAVSIPLWIAATLVYLRNPTALDTGWWLTTVFACIALWLSASQALRSGITSIAICCCAINFLVLMRQLNTAWYIEYPLLGQGVIAGYIGFLGIYTPYLFQVRKKY